MNSRLKIAAVVAAAVAATGAAAVSPSWSQPDAASSGALTLVGKSTGEAFLDHGSQGPTVGDEFVTGQRVLRRGRPVGRAGGSCQIVAPTTGPDRFTFHCTVTLRLPAGQIALDGLATFGEQGPQPMTMAITGGTGNYRLARGQGAIEERPDGETRYRLAIRN
jgi:Dirigent-like protein